MIRAQKILKWLSLCYFKEGLIRGPLSVITGSSVHNQRIERLWRDVFRAVAFSYYKLFYGLESLRLLNHLDNIQLYTTFIPRINDSLEIFRQGWNQHAISHENNCTLLQSKLISSGKISDDFYKCVEHDYGIVYDGPLPTSINNVVIPRVDVALTEDGLQHLHQIDVLRDSDDLGADIFLEVLNINFLISLNKTIKSVNTITQKNCK